MTTPILMCPEVNEREEIALYHRQFFVNIFFMKNNFLTLVEHFSKTNGILMLYLLIR